MDHLRIAFRTDSNHEIGTGHFMRCLTLADELSQQRSEISFVSRDLPSHFQHMLVERGMTYRSLPSLNGAETMDELAHAKWLKTSQINDANQTLELLGSVTWDWIIVDHYALDHRFEKQMRSITKYIMVIDDLADRVHDCDVLLDQNFYHDQQHRYIEKVQTHCRQLLGPSYALLRPEFKEMRQFVRQSAGDVRKILVFFGGVDAVNLTGTALEVLIDLNLDVQVDVVIGLQHTHKSDIKRLCNQHYFNCHVETAHMAELMAEADLAIGAGGSSNWERCCLGLPSIVIATAANQVPISSELGRLGACLYLGSIQNTNLKEIKESIELFIFSQPELEKKSRIALSLTNGNGTCCVTQEMQNKMRVEILNSDKNHPIMSYLNDWGASRINVNIVHSTNDLLGGYMLYLVACGEIISEDVIKKFKHALVLHASDVPIGRGWSPHIWSVLEGKNTLTVSLLEVESKVDRGAIWLKTKIKLKGHELLDEINDKLFKAELGLITKGMCAAQEISPRIQENVKSNYFPKRTPKGSRLNINKSLIDQFNLLRVADKDRYPAFFEYLGHKYIVNIEKASHEF